jgi:hypothetical protein
VEISWLDRVSGVTLAMFEDPFTTGVLEQIDTTHPKHRQRSDRPYRP